jgi:hypothetical protein
MEMIASCAEWEAERPQFGVADLNKTVAKVIARGGLEIAAERRSKPKYFRFPL